jgi:hypothetical protein
MKRLWLPGGLTWQAKVDRRVCIPSRSVWTAPARAGALAGAQRPAHAQGPCGAKGKRRLRSAPSPHSKRWRECPAPQRSEARTVPVLPGGVGAVATVRTGSDESRLRS